MKVIEPTNGRIVWYTPKASDPFGGTDGQPLAAIVTFVWNTRLVNLCVFDSSGFSTGVSSVQLLQDGDKATTAGGYCEWMPYQKGQAAKAEALEAKLSVA